MRNATVSIVAGATAAAAVVMYMFLHARPFRVELSATRVAPPVDIECVERTLRRRYPVDVLRFPRREAPRFYGTVSFGRPDWFAGVEVRHGADGYTLLVDAEWTGGDRHDSERIGLEIARLFADLRQSCLADGPGAMQCKVRSPDRQDWCRAASE